MNEENKITMTIDGETVRCQEGQSILGAALGSGYYIPTLCYHPDLCCNAACGLCLVDLNDENSEKPVLACETFVSQDMSISTKSGRVLEARQDRLSEILATHPHACLVCGEREGCDRQTCSFGVPEEERCCVIFNDCELRRLADHIGIKGNTPGYKFQGHLKKIEGPIRRDYNLCVGCARCIKACIEIKDIGALGRVPEEPGLVDVSHFPEDLLAGGCIFCGLCAAVCPTGAMIDSLADKRDLELASPPHPPVDLLVFDSENISRVPGEPGVYVLLNENKEVLEIKGTPDLNGALDEIADSSTARYFRFEIWQMYSQRESELLQQHVQKHGEMPKGGDGDDLF